MRINPDKGEWVKGVAHWREGETARVTLLAQTVRIQETAKTPSCGELGTRYRALSAEGARIVAVRA